MPKHLFSADEVTALPKPDHVCVNAIVIMLRSANQQKVRDIADILAVANDPCAAFLVAVVNKALDR